VALVAGGAGHVEQVVVVGPAGGDEVGEAVEQRAQRVEVVGLERAVGAGERLAAVTAQLDDVAAQRGPRREAVHARDGGAGTGPGLRRVQALERGDGSGRAVLRGGEQAAGAALVVVEVVVEGVLQIGPVRGDAVGVRAELRPAREAVLAGDHELGVGELEIAAAGARVVGGDALERLGVAGAVRAQQLLRALAQLLQARGARQRIGRHDSLLSGWPVVRRLRAGKEGVGRDTAPRRGGLGPSRGQGAAPAARWRA
jgi:hypothetical protein